MFLSEVAEGHNESTSTGFQTGEKNEKKVELIYLTGIRLFLKFSNRAILKDQPWHLGSYWIVMTSHSSLQPFEEGSNSSHFVDVKGTPGEK